MRLACRKLIPRCTQDHGRDRDVDLSAVVVQELDLHAASDGLDHSAVAGAAADGSHRKRRAGGSGRLAERLDCALQAAVGADDQVVFGISPAGCHSERVEDKIGAQCPAHCQPTILRL